ncbi:MAG: hypothetical protein IJZ88_00855 [Clostridia bacterium]|nr:hypothetical protein [Clostridia bacterium]
MKKIISVVISLFMVLSLIPFTASAADEIDFTLRISSETDNELTLVLDYDGGTGFSALDIDVSYDRVRLELKSCEKGAGYVAFEKYLNDNDALSICSINQNQNPVKVSMANTIGFKAIDGKKSVITLTFAKVPGTKFAEEDVTLDFTNCQTASFENIAVNFDYDLTAPVQGATEKTEQDATEYPQQTSADNVDEAVDSEIGDSVEGEAQQTPAQSGSEDEPAEKNDTDDGNSKTVIIIAAVAVLVVGAAVIVLFVIKSKKKK